MKSFSTNKIITEKYDSKLKLARYWVLSNKIHIDESNPSLNWSITAATNEWCNGSGTWSDPFVIKNVVIDGQETESCILINNSIVPFIIENCTLFNSGDGDRYSKEAGIKLVSTCNGTIINNDCSMNDAYGIYLSNSENNTLSANTVNDNIFTGVFLESLCINNTIIGNEASDNNNDGIRIVSNCDFNKILLNNVHDNGGSGISVEGGQNNTISNNLAYRNDQYGVLIRYTINNTINGNEMKRCGIGLDGSITEMSSNKIDESNQVNNRAVYFYFNKTSLATPDFVSYGSPGQIILI